MQKLYSVISKTKSIKVQKLGFSALFNLNGTMSDYRKYSFELSNLFLLETDIFGGNCMLIRDLEAGR